LILVDSCGWLEVLVGAPLGEEYRVALETPSELLVPTVCLLEVTRRLGLQYGLAEAGHAASQMTQGVLVDLDAALAFNAARLGVETRLPCADSIIYATARRYHAELWTHDAHFRGLPGVRFVEAPATT
jgi:predicted nucleic acid-binding protein